MTASTRFLGLAVLAWAGVRALSLGIVPGSSAVASSLPASSPSTLPVPESTQFPALDPVSAGPDANAYARPPVETGPRYAPYPYTAASYAPAYARRALVHTVYLPASYDAAPRQSRVRVLRDDGRSYFSDSLMPEPRRLPFAGEPSPPEPPPLELASTGLPSSRGPASVPTAEAIAPSFLHKSRRFDLSSWAMMRGKPGDILGPNSLAPSGPTLGGSQAGARLTYWVTPNIGASLRASSPIGGARGGEAALGLRFRPWSNIPFAITAERRQRFGRAGGRNDFAIFADGGLWDTPMPLGFRLNAYAQAGVVGIKRHDLFGDGAFTLTRPLWRNISAGFGMWGGAQPHLYRIDAGPRITIRMKHGISVHADYRHRLKGTAFPSSGPAITIAGDF